MERLKINQNVIIDSSTLKEMEEEVFSNFDPNRYYVLPSRTSKLKMMPMWDSEWSLRIPRIPSGYREEANCIFPSCLKTCAAKDMK